MLFLLFLKKIERTYQLPKSLYSIVILNMATWAILFDRIEEKDLLQQIVEQAHECKKCLREILDFALSYLDKDLTVVCEKLTIALKVLNPFVLSVCYDLHLLSNKI